MTQAAAAGSPPLLSLVLGADGSCRFSAVAAPGTGLTLEVWMDLVSWEEAAVREAGPEGLWQHDLTLLPGVLHSFYRLRMGVADILPGVP